MHTHAVLFGPGIAYTCVLFGPGIGSMATGVLVTRPCDLLPDESWWCETAPGTASGFKGVSPFGKKWRARAWVAGKGMRTVWVAASAAEAAWMLARWKHYPCELPSPQSKPFKAASGTSRESDGEARAPLSPRRLSGGNQRVDEWHASEPAKRQKRANSESESRSSVPVDWETQFSYVPY